MKNNFFTGLFLLALCSVSWAQTDKGRWQLGAQIGNFKYQNEGQYATKAFAGSITPTVGYFVIKNLLVGTGVPLSYSTAYLESPNDYKVYDASYGLSPFINYYFGQSALKPYVGITYSYNRTISHYQSTLSPESTSKGYSTVLAPHLGVAYFVTRNVGLNAGLSLNIQHIEPGNTNRVLISQSSFYYADTRFFSLDIGFQLYFGR